MKTEPRYCKICEQTVMHDVQPDVSMGEKVFCGVVTFGMIPLFEAMTKGAPNDPGMFAKIYTCQKCSNEITVE